MNYKVTVAYDGSNYYGFQRQKNCRTVQGELEKVLSIVFKEEIGISASGRTDRGVHALNQVVNFTTGITIEASQLKYALNRLIPDDISVLDVSVECGSFHARFSAVSKKYRYIIATEDDLFKRKYKYYVGKELNIDLMKKAACLLIGEHDFYSFSNNRKTDKSTVRDIKSIDIYREGKDIYIDITANSFLYNMVRVIVMYLINIALGKIDYNKTSYLLENHTRELTRLKAPASGLYLVKVYYD